MIMKQIHLILILVILVISKFLFGQIDTMNNKVFPSSWDKKNNLDGSEVIAWVHNRDTVRDLEYRLCITVTIGEDSVGGTEIYLKELYTNEEPFKKWIPSYIHYGSDSLYPFGYYDFHIEKFDHIPSKTDIYELLNRWKFKFAVDGWETMEFGYNPKLWIEIFGFIPKELE